MKHSELMNQLTQQTLNQNANRNQRLHATTRIKHLTSQIARLDRALQTQHIELRKWLTNNHFEQTPGTENEIWRRDISDRTIFVQITTEALLVSDLKATA